MNSEFVPVVERLTPVPDVMDMLRAVADLPQPILFDSADPHSDLSRYSFLTADPWWTQRIDAESEAASPRAAQTAFDSLRQLGDQWHTPRVEGLPPFQGGLAGLLGYELNRCFESIPAPVRDSFQIPRLVVGAYDWVIAWDHRSGEAWLISQGCMSRDGLSRRQVAESRVEQIQDRIASTRNHAGLKCRSDVAWMLDVPRRLTLDPQFPLVDSPVDHVVSNFRRDEYLAAVQRVIDYIYAGDIFQANLSQRLLSPASLDPVSQYQRLRERNPAPFAGFFAADDWVVMSASPERFLSLRDGEVETRPIKGTRRRQAAPEADLYTRDELRQSGKDMAENVMIVDLLRNDLSRICQPGSVRVPSLCEVESYETVQHLVSTVCGRLKHTVDAWDMIAATFPGGSITGAPKVRAMQIIGELERDARGPYCGSLFYQSWDGTFDCNILIRTFTQRGGWVQFPVGGGIVAASDPVAEYEETLHKAAGMLRALEP